MNNVVIGIYAVSAVLSAYAFWKHDLEECIEKDRQWRERDPAEYASTGDRHATLGLVLQIMFVSLMPLMNTVSAFMYVTWRVYRAVHKYFRTFFNIPLVRPKRSE